MAHDTAGDPVSGIKWTRRTTEKIAEQLRSGGIDVCPNTVAKLLRGLGYRLRSNAKKLNRQKDPGVTPSSPTSPRCARPSPKRASRW